MQTKTMESNRTRFKDKKQQISGTVTALAAKYGFTGTPERVNVKELLNKKLDVIIDSWEFTGDWIFVFYEQGLTTHCDIDQNPCPEFKLYTLPHTANYRDVYKEANFTNRPADNQPFLVPRSEFIPIDETYLRKMTPESVYGKTGHIPFPDLEISSFDVEADEDEHMSKMTVVDYIAIHTCTPVSSKSYINNKIKQAIAYKNGTRN